MAWFGPEGSGLTAMGLGAGVGVGLGPDVCISPKASNVPLIAVH